MATLSKLKALVDKASGGKPRQVSKFLTDLAEKAGLSYATAKKAYNGDNIQDAKALLIQALYEEKLSEVWEEPKKSAPNVEELRGKSTLYPPKFEPAVALKRFKEKEHMVTSVECAGCFQALREAMPNNLPISRAACLLQHGYVQRKGRIFWREDVPPEEPVAEPEKKKRKGK